MPWDTDQVCVIKRKGNASFTVPETCTIWEAFKKTYKY